jgi:hypothetical protein
MDLKFSAYLPLWKFQIKRRAGYQWTRSRQATGNISNLFMNSTRR